MPRRKDENMQRLKLWFIFMLAICLFACKTQEGFTDDWQRIYLATYPRSGNHWARYLIEEATNFATSSVYPDNTPPHEHLLEPFPWGGYACDHGYTGNRIYPQNDDIVVIKTHFPALQESKFDCKPSLKTIRIVRHPVDSIYSFYVYIYQGNIPQQIIPTPLVKTFVESWKKFQTHWNNESNVVTFRYEDLYNDPYTVLRNMLEAIGYSVQPEDIERAIAKYPPSGGLLKYLDKFQSEDLNLISQELSDLMQQFDYSIPTIDCRIDHPEEILDYTINQESL